MFTYATTGTVAGWRCLLSTPIDLPAVKVKLRFSLGGELGSKRGGNLGRARSLLRFHASFPCVGHKFRPVRGRCGLQLQIRTLTERLYQLGTGEEESFGHAREGVPSPGGPNQKDCYERGFAKLPPRGGERNKGGGAPLVSNKASFDPGSGRNPLLIPP